MEGCNEWPMRDSSGLCYFHNPAQAEKRKEWILSLAKKRVEGSSKGTCRVKGCRTWVMKDGAGFCYQHHPEFKEKRHQERLRHPIPWLGLENMAEARGLLFYSLETHQPLLTLRALTKIVSLHRLERLARSKGALLAEPPEKLENLEREEPAGDSGEEE